MTNLRVTFSKKKPLESTYWIFCQNWFSIRGKEKLSSSLCTSRRPLCKLRPQASLPGMDKRAECKVFNLECTNLSSEEAEAQALMYGRLSRSTLIKSLSRSSPTLLADSSLDSEEAELLSSDALRLLSALSSQREAHTFAYHLIGISSADDQSLQSDSKHGFTIQMAWHVFGQQLPPTGLPERTVVSEKIVSPKLIQVTSSGQSEES